MDNTENPTPNLVIISHANQYGIRASLKVHKDFMKGNKNRRRVLKRLLEEKEKKHNFTRHANVEISSEQLRVRVSDFTTNMRRPANDPLPCTLMRKPHALHNITGWNNDKDMLLSELLHTLEFYQQLREFHELTCNNENK